MVLIESSWVESKIKFNVGTSVVTVQAMHTLTLFLPKNSFYNAFNFLRILLGFCATDRSLLASVESMKILKNSYEFWRIYTCHVNLQKACTVMFCIAMEWETCRMTKMLVCIVG